MSVSHAVKEVGVKIQAPERLLAYIQALSSGGTWDLLYKVSKRGEENPGMTLAASSPFSRK